MPTRVEWDGEARLAIIQTYFGNVVLEDYYEATDQVAALAKSVSYTVHSIMDRSGIVSSVNPVMPALIYANRTLPSNLGLRIIINPSIYTHLIVNIGLKIAPRVISQVRIARSLEEAREIVCEYSDIRVY